MAATAAAQSLVLSEWEATAWRDLMRQRYGLYFSEARTRVLLRALQTRAHIHGARSLTDYYHQVVPRPDSDPEWTELLDLLLNKETSFFRHPASFEALVSDALPELKRLKHQEGDHVLRVWSVGCSTGQEVYSLVMTLLEAPAARGWEVIATGSDLSVTALGRAREGYYRPYEARTIGEAYRAKYLTEAGHDEKPCYRLSAEVRARVTFQRINLADPETYPDEVQDVAFCQNVLIYFQPAEREQILQRLTRRLRPGGFLFLAPAEAVGLRLDGIERVPLAHASAFRRPL
jgi:chemotaxis methyl-accepting protein methylase